VYYPDSNVTWTPYGFHMTFHMVFIWDFMRFAPDTPYGLHIG
jgi:hypothetical protein